MTPFGMSRGRTAALAVSVCAAVVLSAGAEASIHGWRYEPGTAGTIAADPDAALVFDGYDASQCGCLCKSPIDRRGSDLLFMLCSVTETA